MINKIAVLSRLHLLGAALQVLLIASDSAMGGLVFDWQASSGNLPDQISPSWTLNNTADIETPELFDGILTLSTSSNAENMGYNQFEPIIDTTSPFFIEAQLKYISGSDTSNRGAIRILFVTEDSFGIALNVGEDEVFFDTSNISVGPKITVDTNDAFHTYRMEYDGIGGVTFLHDGSPVLTGSTFSNSSHFGISQSIAWGEGSRFTNGISEWTSFRHNALVSTPVVVDVDPRATYLRAASELAPYPADAKKIDLATVIPGNPIEPGDWIELQRVGDFLFTQAECDGVEDKGPHGDCTLRNMDAVFSGSDVLLEDPEAMRGNKTAPIPPESTDPPFSRVPDAIAFFEGDADFVFTRPDPFDNMTQEQLTDIAQDFTIDLEGDLLNPDPVLVKVPEGATHLFVGAGDTQWAENILTPGINQFGVRITLVNAPGDFDMDGDADGYDFIQWQRGETPELGSAEELASWESQFGGTVSAVAAAVPTPEPFTLLLVILAGLLSCSTKRRA